MIARPIFTLSLTAAALLLPLGQTAAQTASPSDPARVNASTTEVTRQVERMTSSEAASEAAAEAGSETAAEGAAQPSGAALAQCGEMRAPWINGPGDAALWSEGHQARLSGQGPHTRAFQMESSANIRLEVSASGRGDPVLRLYDGDGNLISENDDVAGTLDSRLIEALPPGLYCAQADDLRGNADLTLQIGLEGAPPLLASRELACGPETEAVVFGGAALDAALKSGIVTAQSDATGLGYLRFTLAEPTSFSLRAEAATGIDPSIALFDSAGRRLAENDDADGLSARLDFQPELPAGTYCLGVRASEARAGSIPVSAEPIDREAYMRRAFASGQLVPMGGEVEVKTLAFNGTQAEVVLQGSAVNWFRFDLAESSLVSISTYGTLSGADTLLRLFDGTGRMIEENDDREGDTNAAIVPRHLAPGRYYLALSDHRAQQGLGAPLRPVALLAERFIRAPRD